MPNNKIATFSGALVDPWNLKLSDIHIEDIAHSLSQINRYGGHTRIPYTVAQHSVILAGEAKRRWGIPEALYMLLHDGEEAYLYDLARPIKKRTELMHYCKACDRASRAIFAKFEVNGFTEERLGELKALDDEMVAHEAGSLMLVCDEWAEELRSIVQTFYPRIEMWSSTMAEQQFLKMFHSFYHRDIS